MAINRFFGILLFVIGISSIARADINYLSKSMLPVEQKDCDPDALDCFDMVSAMVEVNRSALIKDAALASMAAYNDKSVVALVSKPIRSQIDDNARKIMKARGEEVILFGEKVPHGVISFNREESRITVAFHGTESRADMVIDANFIRYSNPLLLKSGTIHGGFNNAYMTARDAMFAGIDAILKNNNLDVADVKFLATGHSLGGALATLAAVDIKQKLIKEKASKLYLVTFSSPRLVDYAGAEEITGIIGENRIMRIWRAQDPVPAVAVGFFGFKHVGGKSIKLEATTVIPSMANHKMNSILLDAFSQENVRFVVDHVGFTKTISNASKSLVSKLNPMSWFY